MRKKKSVQIHDGAKSAIFFAISAFIIKGISFIVTPIFTRIISIEDYGVVTTYNSWLTIIEIFALLGLTSAGVFNVGLKDNKKNQDEYISSCLGLCNIATLFIFVLIFIFKKYLGNIIILNDSLLLVMFIHFLFNPSIIFWITKEKYVYNYKLPVIISILMAVISQVIPLVLILYIKSNGYLYKIIGNEIGNLIFTIPIFIYLIIKGKKYFDLKRWKTILVLALPLLPHYLAQHIMSSSDKIMISNMVNTSDAAIYGLVSTIGLICLIFWDAINGSLVPYTFENIDNKKYDKVGSIGNKLLIFYCIICILIMLVAPEIMKILAPKEYYKGIYIIPPLIFVVFLHSAYNLYANIEFYYKKTKGIAIATVISAIMNLILNYIFIPKYSFIAAAYTTLVSYLILIFIHYINYKKCTEKEIYNNKNIFRTIILLLIISFIISYLYLYSFIIRYILLIIILIIVIINRQKIISIIKTVK